MYVTRPLSMYRREPAALSLPSPEGPNSGVLVIQDEEAEPTCCFGLFKCGGIRSLPFPQNKNLKVRYVQQYGQNTAVHIDHVHFIPVLNQPLSSNQYYVIKRKGKHKGEAYIGSTEEDMETCCFCRCITDLKPQPLDPENTYQKFEIQRCGRSRFVAKSVAPADGFPPHFLRRKGWNVDTSTPHKFQLNEAPGLNRDLRACLPDFNFTLSEKNSRAVVVGKWYCPFMFIKEGTLKEQVKSSTYYEMTLEQQWMQIFYCENNYNQGNNIVNVDVVVENEVVAIAGRKAVHNKSAVVDGVTWFRASNDSGEGRDVGLSLAITERLKSEAERFGWTKGETGREDKVKMVEAFTGIGEWKKFGCYVLVESFVLKRMDGSLVLTYDFRHTNQVRSKWE